jgi:hypothetical protein
LFARGRVPKGVSDLAARPIRAWAEAPAPGTRRGTFLIGISGSVREWVLTSLRPSLTKDDVWPCGPTPGSLRPSMLARGPPSHKGCAAHPTSAPCVSVERTGQVGIDVSAHGSGRPRPPRPTRHDGLATGRNGAARDVGASITRGSRPHPAGTRSKDQGKADGGNSRQDTGRRRDGLGPLRHERPGRGPAPHGLGQERRSAGPCRVSAAIWRSWAERLGRALPHVAVAVVGAVRRSSPGVI